jgi:hypothetical protein
MMFRVRWYFVLTIGVTFALGGAGMVATGAEHGWSVLLFFGLCATVAAGQLWPNLFIPRAVPPEDLLEQFPGPATLRVGRMKFLYLLVGAAVFGGVTLSMMQDEAVDWFAVLFLWLGILGCAVAIPIMAFLLVRGSSLQLGREGLSIRHGWRRQFLPWADVEGFEVYMVPGSSQQKILVYDDPIGRDSASGAINTALTGHNAALPDNYGLPHDELAWLLNQWRERALETMLHTPSAPAIGNDLRRGPRD